MDEEEEEHDSQLLKIMKNAVVERREIAIENVRPPMRPTLLGRQTLKLVAKDLTTSSNSAVAPLFTAPQKRPGDAPVQATKRVKESILNDLNNE